MKVKFNDLVLIIALFALLIAIWQMLDRHNYLLAGASLLVGMIVNYLDHKHRRLKEINKKKTRETG